MCENFIYLSEKYNIIFNREYLNISYSSFYEINEEFTEIINIYSFDNNLTNEDIIKFNNIKNFVFITKKLNFNFELKKNVFINTPVFSICKNDELIFNNKNKTELIYKYLNIDLNNINFYIIKDDYSIYQLYYKKFISFENETEIKENIYFVIQKDFTFPSERDILNIIKIEAYTVNFNNGKFVNKNNEITKTFNYNLKDKLVPFKILKPIDFLPIVYIYMDHENRIIQDYPFLKFDYNKDMLLKLNHINYDNNNNKFKIYFEYNFITQIMKYIFYNNIKHNLIINIYEVDSSEKSLIISKLQYNNKPFINLNIINNMQIYFIIDEKFNYDYCKNIFAYCIYL